MFQSEAAKKIVDFKSQEEVFQTADIVSLHVPYFPGKNDRFVNADLINLMKPQAVLVNTARAEIVDISAVVAALQNDRLSGFDHEADYFGKKVDQIKDLNLQALIDLYPRVLITPHLGSYTEEALVDMIKISFDNFHEVLATGTCDNLVQPDK